MLSSTMRDRIRAVLLMTVRRRLLWLMALGFAGLLFIGNGAFLPRKAERQRVLFYVVNAGAPHTDNTPGLPGLAPDKSRELEMVRALEISSDPRTSPDPSIAKSRLRRFPNLDSVTLGPAAATPEMLAGIAEHPAVRWLQIHGRWPRVSQDVLKQLGDHLETLRIDQIVTDERRDPTAVLPKVGTLALRTSSAQLPAVLRALPRMPDLRQMLLILPVSDALDAAATAELAEFAPRAALFIEQGNSERNSRLTAHYDDPRNLGELRAALPGHAVWHARMPLMSVFSVLMAVFSAILLASMLAIQLQAAFGVPAAQLSPRYFWPHVIVAGLLLVIGVATVTIMQADATTRAIPLVTMQLVIVGLYLTTAFPLEQSLGSYQSATIGGRSEFSTSVRRMAAGFFPLLAIAIAATYVTFAPYQLDSYLRGESPGAAALALFAGIGLITVSVAAMRDRAVSMSESGATQWFSFADLQKTTYRRPTILRGWERRLERLKPRSTDRQTLWNAKALRAGNAMTIGSSMLFTIVPVGAMLIANGMMYAFGVGNTNTFLASIPAFIGIFLPVMVEGAAAQAWWQRRKVFARELLYPMSRGEFIHSFIGAILVDVAIFGLIVTIVVGAGLAIWLPRSVDASAVVAGALSFWSVLAIVGTGMVFLMTIRHAIAAIMIAYFGGCGLFLIAGLLAWAILGDVVNSKPQLVFIVGSIWCLLFSALLLAAGRRRLLRMEWANVTAK